MALLRVDDLFRFYHPGDGEVRALRGASLEVERGETVALLGPSGSGKSTLLACVAGLDEPDGGVVTVAGDRMTRRPEAERAALRARAIGVLAQHENLFDHLTVGENVALPLALAGRRDPPAVERLLSDVGLAGRAHALPSTLSGGERARAGLAVALAAGPPLLLADEPTAEVDAATEASILDMLERRRLDGGAALIATHSPALARRATRVLAIEDGRVVQRHAHEPTGVVVAPRRATGRSMPAKPIVVLTDVRKSHGTGARRVTALVGASCRVLEGDRIALVGPSGSGKSTLLDLMAGLRQPSEGSVTWPGLRAREPLRPRQIGIVFQSPSLLPSLTALENVRLPLDLGPPGTAAAMDPREALALVGLPHLADTLPDRMSGGEAQRVAIARALVCRCPVLLADEPTGQLDRKTARHVFDVLLGAVEATGSALVVATHDPEIAGRLDKAWFLRSGHLVAPEAVELATC